MSQSYCGALGNSCTGSLDQVSGVMGERSV